MDILLDTSIWALYLRPGGQNEVKTEVRKALEGQRVWTCQVVIAELLVGARDDVAFEDLAEVLSALPEVSLDETIWKGAARIGYQMRRAGTLVPLPDLLIAQAAISRGLELWHADADFERIRQVVPLATRSFLP